MNFRQEIVAHYTQDDGLISEERDPLGTTTGNGALSLGVYYLLLSLRRELMPADSSRFAFTIDRITADFWKPGLYLRSARDFSLNSHDNYRGIAAASLILGTQHAREIYRYGKAHHWYFDNRDPKDRVPFSFKQARAWLQDRLSPWHGRFLPLPGFYALCAGENPSPLQLAALSAAIKLDTLNHNDDSAKILTWISVQVCKARGVCQDATEAWEFHIADDYGGMSTVFGIYFGVNHPFFRKNSGLLEEA